MNENTTKIVRGGVFPDEATFQRIYEECLENEPQASQKTRGSYDKMQTWFEEYVCAIQEDAVRYAYQCGYEAARKEIAEHSTPAILSEGGDAA